MSEQKSQTKGDKGISQVTLEEKRSWTSIAFIWAGTMVCIPMLMVGGVVPPIMGIIIADYWVICKGNKETWKPIKGVNWIGIIAWVFGGGFGLLETLGVVQVFSAALDGIVIAFVVYIILYKLLSNTALAGKGEMTIEEATAIAK